MIPRCLLSATLLLAAACEVPRPVRMDSSSEQTSLPGLVDGSTTREEVLLRLGAPSGRFEGDRILTFMLGETGDGLLVPVAGDTSWRDPRLREWAIAQISLVTVFDGAGRLVRHRLVRVN